MNQSHQEYVDSVRRKAIQEQEEYEKRMNQLVDQVRLRQSYEDIFSEMQMRRRHRLAKLIRSNDPIIDYYSQNPYSLRVTPSESSDEL